MIDLFFRVYLEGLGLSAQYAKWISLAVLTLVVLLLAVIATWITRRFFLPMLVHFIHNNRVDWDDPLLESNFLPYFSYFVPLTIINIALQMMLPGEGTVEMLARNAVQIFFVLVSVLSFTSLLTSIEEIYKRVKQTQGSPIRGYIDVGRIAAYLLGIIIVISIITGRSTLGLLSLMGGVTAVTMLVFKDSILGFVASIQLLGTDMLRVGDWIEMPKFGADGDIIDLSIHTVRVQNFDKTITTIPTYSLIANSFKNWRGMKESGGRRIKRAIYLDMNTIRFVERQELVELRDIRFLREYIDGRQREIEQYNQRHNINIDHGVNGRQQTNIGVFRAYIQAYLRQRPDIHKDMTFLVRQLAPGENGLPLEIYVFSRDTVWENYEIIQADIFDHLFAVLPRFGLRVFQNPTELDIANFMRQG